MRLNVTILASVVILVANIGSGIFLARGLGPTGRGILTAALLFGTLIANIGSLGIPDALVYTSGRSNDDRSPGLVTAFWIGVPQSLILVSVGLVLIPRLLGGSTHPALSSSLAYLAIIPIFLFSQYAASVLQGRLRLVEFNLVRVLAPIVYTVGVLVLWVTHILSVRTAVATSLLSGLVMCVVALLTATKVSSRHFSWRVARDLLAYGVRSQAGNLAGVVVAQLDLLVLAALVSTRELGYYTVATSAAMIGALIPSAASLVLFPTFATQPPEIGRPTLARFILWGLGGSAILSPILLILLPWAVVPVYGRAFSKASPLALILVGAYLLRGSNQMLVAILRGFGAPTGASLGQVAGLIVMAALVPVGVSVGGVQGAATGVVVSTAVAFIWLLSAAWRQSAMSVGYASTIWRADLVQVYVDFRRTWFPIQR